MDFTSPSFLGNSFISFLSSCLALSFLFAMLSIALYSLFQFYHHLFFFSLLNLWQCCQSPRRITASCGDMDVEGNKKSWWSVCLVFHNFVCACVCVHVYNGCAHNIVVCTFWARLPHKRLGETNVGSFIKILDSFYYGHHRTEYHAWNFCSTINL